VGTEVRNVARIAVSLDKPLDAGTYKVEATVEDHTAATMLVMR
jgi:hypothetical protein